MDAAKLNLMVSVVCMFLFIALIVIEYDKVQEVKAVRQLFNETDYSCCSIYRSRMMPMLCSLHPYNATAFAYPTIMGG